MELGMLPVNLLSERKLPTNKDHHMFWTYVAIDLAEIRTYRLGTK